MQHLLTLINEQHSLLIERWESLLQRLQDIASLQQDPHRLPAYIALFREYGISLYSDEKQPSLLLGNSMPTLSTSYTLLFWSQSYPDPSQTQQWHALALRLLALLVYQEQYGTFPVNVQWRIDLTHTPYPTPTGPHGYSPIQATACLCDLAEPSLFPALALGTRGRLRTVLKVIGRQHGLHSLHGSFITNPAWRLTWALNTLKDRREDVCIDGFYDTLLPPDDDDVALLAHPSLLAYNDDALLLGLQGQQARYTAQFVPSCTITSMSTMEPIMAQRDNDPSPSWLPAQAQAILDFSLVPNQDPQDIYMKLQQHLLAQGMQDVQVEHLESVPPQHTQFRHAFVQAVYAATQTLHTLEHTHALRVHTQDVLLIPFATDSYTPISYVPGTPTVFAQFGPHSFRGDTQADSFATTIVTSIAHTILLLENLHHATVTTR